VATVDENGAVDIVAAGTTIISAAFAGNDDYTKKTASYTLTVSKAKTELKFSAATAQATMNAEFQAPTLTKSPENLEGVEFTSSNTAAATVDKNTGAVTLVGAGETTIKAAFAGSTVYEASEASYTLTVNRAAGEGYLLWVNDTQVTSDNADDVLGHKDDSSKPYYIYNKDKKQLYMDNDQTKTTVIESRMPELTIYIKDANKIKRIFFNNTGDTSNKGNLTFTTNGTSLANLS
jgi:Bacterial Ig-like domain (group 2).